MNYLRVSMATLIAVSVSACDTRRDAEAEPTAESTAQPPTTDEGETVSILRPDVEAELEDVTETPLEDLRVTIGFPDGGAELSSEAIAALQGILASEQMGLGLPITLRAHSDAAGSDAANARAAEERGLAVAKWLIENGVDDDRINIIVFGEQNPIQPNALPDGTANEAGRAANRRVEIEVPALVLDLTVTTTDDGDGVENSAESGD